MTLLNHYKKVITWHKFWANTDFDKTTFSGMWLIFFFISIKKVLLPEIIYLGCARVKYKIGLNEMK